MRLAALAISARPFFLHAPALDQTATHEGKLWGAGQLAFRYQQSVSEIFSLALSV